jgi:hypothetical protein
VRATVVAALVVASLSTALVGTAAHRRAAYAQAAAPEQARVGQGPAAVGPHAGAPFEQCATMRRVEAADVVRVDGDRIYFLDESRGLVSFDVTDIDQPVELGVSPIVGVPVGCSFVEGSSWSR